jgi:hypothetical protein
MQPLADHPDHQITPATALVRDQSHDAQIAQDSSTAATCPCGRDRRLPEFDHGSGDRGCPVVDE